MTKEELIANIAKYISTPAGRAKLAQSMLQPLRPQEFYRCRCCETKWRTGMHPDNGCEMREIWDVCET